MNVNRPVALIDDDELLEDVLKLAAAAGGEVERVPDAAAVRLRWAGAPLVVLDLAGARACRQLALPRRPRVVLVCAQSPPADLWEHAVGIGAERVVELPGGEPWLVEALADAVEAPSGASGRVLAVLGGRGGAGASVLVAAVGLAVLRTGRSALLVDCDPLGGGLDLVLGAEGEVGLRWPDLRLRSGRVAASSLHAALPGRSSGTGRLTMLSGAREGTGPAPEAVTAVIEAGRRAGETVVCDLPRDVGDSGYAALDRADLAVIVVPAEVRACVSAKLVGQRVLDRGLTARVLVRGPAPGGLRAEQVAEAVRLPLLTSMPPEPGLARALERGEFRLRAKGPLATAAHRTLRALAGGPRDAGQPAEASAAEPNIRSVS